MFLGFFVATLLLFLFYPTKAAIIFDKTHSPYRIDSTLTIAENDTLIILEGTTLYVDTAVDIIVFGVMHIRGTVGNPVKILPKLDTVGWGQIKLLKKGSHCKFEYAEIVDGAVIAIGVHLCYRHVHFLNRQKLPNNYNITRVNWGSADLQNCSIEGPRKGEGFLLKNMDKAIIRNCIFSNIPDAVEWVRIKNSQITNNMFVDIPDDAIDLNNCTNILIDSNVIIHAYDRGLEIGSERFGSSTGIVAHRNLIINCKEGINFKEGSSGEILNNTLYQNKYGVVCKEILEGSGGSRVIIENTIISQSSKKTIDVDSLSEVIVNHSLSDKEQLPGLNNLFKDSQFADPENQDFHLQKSSPCIDVGSFFCPLDADGTRSDIGAFSSVRDTKTFTPFTEAKVSYFNTPSFNLEINFCLPHAQNVKIEVYNIKGKVVSTVVDKKLLSGNYSIPFQPTTINEQHSGINLCTFEIGEKVNVFKGLFID